MSPTRALSEQHFTEQVIQLARFYGWRAAHFRAAQTTRGWRTPVQGDGKGFPDLVLVRPPELIFAELKTPRGRLSREQAGWVAALEDVSRGLAHTRAIANPFSALEPFPVVDVYVWTPDDFDALHGRLARGRRRQERAA